MGVSAQLARRIAKSPERLKTVQPPMTQINIDKELRLKFIIPAEQKFAHHQLDRYSHSSSASSAVKSLFDRRLCNRPVTEEGGGRTLNFGFSAIPDHPVPSLKIRKSVEGFRDWLEFRRLMARGFADPLRENPNFATY